MILDLSRPINDLSDSAELSIDDYVQELQQRPLRDILVALMLMNDIILFLKDRYEKKCNENPKPKI
jgi:hypothetical protein